MEARSLLLVVFCSLELWDLNHVTAQFPNMFGGMMGNTGSMAGSTGSKQGGNGSSCITNSVSCLPWCTRAKDAKGCLSCSCHSGGMNSMTGINSMAGMNSMSGMNPMSGMSPMTGLNPMSGYNPMAGMYSGLSGGQSPMTAGGGGPRQGANCGTIPRTCPFPQPWCQRVANKSGCVKCLCGADLATFMQHINGQTQKFSNSTTTTTAATPTSAATGTTLTATITSLVTLPTPSSGMSCLATFYCTKVCDNGYKTDRTNCPVCDCVGGDLIDTPVDATDPPGKKHQTTPTTTARPIVTDHVTACPGIFDCALICNNGYKSDSMGCPVCECMKN